jgi:hypothetical protein
MLVTVFYLKEVRVVCAAWQSDAPDVRIGPQFSDLTRGILEAGVPRCIGGGALGQRHPLELRAKENHAAGKGNNREKHAGDKSDPGVDRLEQRKPG